eukprot:751614-Hanusia_phi.AAC.1
MGVKVRKESRRGERDSKAESSSSSSRGGGGGGGRLRIAQVDWRRSFITTNVNPYYDSFIQWQFHKLR